MTVTQRMDIHAVAPEAYKAVMPLQKFASSGSDAWSCCCSSRSAPPS